MRKLAFALIIVPLAILVVGLAVANRHNVVISFDPFNQTQPAFALTLPLYAVLLAVVTMGVVVGGLAAWLRQGKWRRSARLAQARANEIKAELDSLKLRSGASELPRPGMRLEHPSRLTIPPPAA